LVYDGSTKLYWQRSSSEELLTYDEALAYVDNLNRVKFAGYTDWRLPTLEEAMSLMEREQKNGKLYINPVFDRRPTVIWTASKQAVDVVWYVDFNVGRCAFNVLGGGDPVRAVRFRQ